MPRLKTYGKKSRAVFDLRDAFASSSPEQPEHEHLKTRRDSKASTKSEDARAERPVEIMAGHTRKALQEKQANAVVLPIEALEIVKETEQKRPKSRRKGDPAPYKKNPTIEQNGKVEQGGRHTFFEEDQVDNVQEAEARSTQRIRPRTPPQPRRSPRKSKKSPAKLDRDGVPQAERAKSAKSKPGDARPRDAQVEAVQQTKCIYTQHCSGLLPLSSHPLTDFAGWSAQLSDHFSVTKIAEASFGEVYRLSLMADMSDFMTSTDESVFKVIPLKAPTELLPSDKRRLAAALKKEEFRSNPADVANEVRLLQRMSSIPGFTNFRDVRILQGRPPPAFIDAFQAWNTAQRARKKNLSHFPDPTKNSSYTDDQLWAVIEMQDAGNDLERLVESGSCTQVWTVWDIFWQTVLAIAKGEEGAEFEHRDLHLGNICVRTSSSLTSTDNEEDAILKAIKAKRKLNFTTLETTIIDYTISRCAMSSPSDVAYTDLSDPLQAALFEGDSTYEYQYDIYRYMRGALFFSRPFAFEQLQPSAAAIEATGRNWKQFHPQTNLVWLHLVLYKLLEQISWPSEKRAPSKKKDGGDACLKWGKAQELEGVLLKVQEMLDPEAICANGVNSATELVGYAISEGWLDVRDVIGDGMDESALVSQLEGLEI